MSNEAAERLHVAAENIEVARSRALAVHPTEYWTISVEPDTDPVARNSAEARGLQAFTVTRQRVKP